MAALKARDAGAIGAALRGLAGSEAPTLDAIRPHLHGLTLDLAAAAQLGKALMGLCPRLGPPLVARRPARARSITVMGTSHVRFFGVA